MSIAVVLLDEIAGTVERLHRLHHMQLKGLLAQTLDRPDAWSPRAASDLKHDVRVMGNDFYRQLKDFVTECTGNVSTQAQKDVELSMPVGIHADYLALDSAACDQALRQIESCLRQDEQSVLSAFRTVQLGAQMRAAGGVDRKVALDLVKGGIIVGLTFKRFARDGRAWSTEVMTRTIARGLMVQLYTEYTLMCLVSNGITTAKIDTPEGAVVFSINGDDPTLQTLEEIEDAYLHPNATRLVSKQ